MNNRSCIILKEKTTSEALIRLVVAPNGEIIADIYNKLPGRGAYITAKRSLIEKAIKHKILINYFQRKLNVANIFTNENLCNVIDELLAKKSLLSLSLGRKAGCIIYGFNNCNKAIREGKVLLMLHSKEARKNGIPKIKQAIFTTKQYTNEDIHQWQLFSNQDLNLAFGNSNATHIAILKHNNAKNILINLEKLYIYRDNL